METYLLALLVGMPLAAHLILSVYAYLDAPRNDMDARKWGLVAATVPLFGFFTYVFEKGERKKDDEDGDMFVDGVFEIHESRADDTRFAKKSRGVEDYDDDDG